VYPQHCASNYSVQGATDFIFGQRGQAFFGGNTISVSNGGCITASGRSSDDTSSCKFNRTSECSLPPTQLLHIVVFDKNTIVLAPGAPSTVNGKIYLGRPWGGKPLASFCPLAKLTSFRAAFAKYFFSFKVSSIPFCFNIPS
jgi:hypothetical protein